MTPEHNERMNANERELGLPGSMIRRAPMPVATIAIKAPVNISKKDMTTKVPHQGHLAFKDRNIRRFSPSSFF